MTIFCLLTGLLLFSLLIAWFSYRKAFHSPKRRKEDPYALPHGEQYKKELKRTLSLIGEMDGIVYEPVSITARDGTVLFGRYYHVRDGAPLQIQFHSYATTVSSFERKCMQKNRRDIL